MHQRTAVFLTQDIPQTVSGDHHKLNISSEHLDHIRIASETLSLEVEVPEPTSHRQIAKAVPLDATTQSLHTPHLCF
jgi:hypothetical protein